MKTAKEIKDAIEFAKKEEEKRLKLVKWAIELIDEASEKMFRELKPFCELQIDVERKEDFENAWIQKEVMQCLADNGFGISRDCSKFILKAK